MELSPADIENLRRYGQEQAAEAAELRLKVRSLEGQNKKLERRLKRVYRSWTWRAGRVLLFPYYAIQWIIERVRRSPTGR
jgi:hypothetical protein